MKKLFLIALLILGVAMPAFAVNDYYEDTHHLRFKTMLWICPECGQEDVQKRKVKGGDSYIHDCSACKHEFNQSGQNSKVYEGIISYVDSEFKNKTTTDFDNDSKAKFDAWVEEQENQ